MDAKLRIYLDQQMYMIWHDFQRDDLGSILRRCLTNDLLTAFGDFAFEHFTTIFRTPNTVVFAAADNVVVRLVPEYHNDSDTTSFYLMK